MPKKITMADLARATGVDVSTVSRAMNDSPLVKPETKKLILEKAAELGYTVNLAARALRRQSSETIGIVIPINPSSEQTISDPFFLEMVGAVSHAAAQRGYDLLISVPSDETSIAEQRLLKTGRADGLIVIGQAGRSDRLNHLGELNRRVVVWGGHIEDAEYVLVGSDNVRGGELATSHLLSLGRKRILFLGDTELPEVALRYTGYENAYREAGMSVPDHSVEKAGFSGKDVYENIRNLFKDGPRHDAIFAASDLLAMTAIQALQSLGLHVPDDISVVGFDDIGAAKLNTPPLTTVRQNIAQGGEMMVDKLLKMIAGYDVQSAYTDSELVIRDSCGGSP